MNEIKIILPPVSHDGVSSGLCYLTQVLSESGIAEASHGLLGGEWGYGADFENDVFMMHHYCWCDREDCPWCASCECPESAYHYLVDGKEVTYHEWMRFYTDRVPHWSEDHPDYERLSTEANLRRSERHDPVCNFCLVNGGKSAPNFYHKPSGLKVWWYKYIGRSMEIEGNTNNWNNVLQECIASLNT